MRDRGLVLCVVALLVAMIASLILGGMKADSFRDRCETLGGAVFYESPSANRAVCLTGFKKIKP